MVYARKFHKLVLIGKQGPDIWNFTMNIAPTDSEDLSDDGGQLIDEMVTLFSGWFPSPASGIGVGFFSSVSLTSIKLNAIGPDGKYVLPTTVEHVFTTPLVGPQSGAGIPQVATAVSLRTEAARGRASKGRFYLPPHAAMGNAQLQADGRLGTSQAGSVADSVKGLIDNINEAYAEPGHDGTGRVSVVSNIGVGAQRPVDRIAIGTVLDTIRSRRNKYVEQYQERLLA